MRKVFSQLGKLFKYFVNFRYNIHLLSKYQESFRPPGHYYSPFVDKGYIKQNEPRVFTKDSVIDGVEFFPEEQFALLQNLSFSYGKLPFKDHLGETDLRYYYDNQYFSYSDAIFLSCLMLEKKPKRIIEIGSGYSSSVMLDINNCFFHNNIALTFVEPYPEERLLSLVKEGDNYTLIRSFVQDLPLDVFDQLEENDILFIDSSHVTKTYSDVNHLLFKVLPRLKKGVIIHVHDIFYPFEYPKEWVYQDRAWNEAYLLRAFLQYNKAFKIILFTSYLEYSHKEWFEKHMPLCLQKHEKWIEANVQYLLDTTGQSIYIQKVA